MKSRNYGTKLTVDESPEQVFAAIKNVQGWWPEIEGSADCVGDKFTHHFQEIHRCHLVVKELIPARRIAWTVRDNYLSFIEDQSEWKNTEIVFEIAQKAGKTALTFTHVGLIRRYQCYDICANGWSGLIRGDLRNLIGRKATLGRNGATSAQVMGSLNTFHDRTG
jgi:hypothetical protein